MTLLPGDLTLPRCPACEYPLDHVCGACGQRVCITKKCPIGTRQHGFNVCATTEGA